MVVELDGRRWGSTCSQHLKLKKDSILDAHLAFARAGRRRRLSPMMKMIRKLGDRDVQGDGGFVRKFSCGEWLSEKNFDGIK